MDLVPVVSRASALRNLTQAWKAELHDFSGPSYALSNQGTAATILCLNSMIVGDDQVNRDGCNISLNRIGLSYTLAGPVAPTVPLTTGV